MCEHWLRITPEGGRIGQTGEIRVALGGLGVAPPPAHDPLADRIARAKAERHSSDMEIVTTVEPPRSAALPPPRTPLAPQLWISKLHWDRS